MEGKLDQTPHFNKHIPRGELVELLSKALLYVEVEAHWKADAMTTNCKTGFSLLETHVCSFDPKAKSSVQRSVAVGAGSNQQINGDPGNKRKADEPTKEDTPVEKRAKRNADDMDVDSTTTAVDCELLIVLRYRIGLLTRFLCIVAIAKGKWKEPPPSAPIPRPIRPVARPNDIISMMKSKLPVGPMDDTPQEAWSLLNGHKSEVRVGVNIIQTNRVLTHSFRMPDFCYGLESL